MTVPGIFWFSLTLNISLILLAIVIIATLIDKKYRDKCGGCMVKSALNSSLNGVIVYDAEGNHVWQNSQTGEYMPALANPENHPENLKDFLVYIHDHAIDPDNSIKKVLEKFLTFNRNPSGFNEVVNLRNGKPGLVSIQSVKSGSIVTISDISHGKKQEEQLQVLMRTNAQMVAAIEATNSGIIVSDPKQPGNPVVFVNSHFANLVGLPREEIIGNGWAFIMDALGYFRLYGRIEESMSQQSRADLEFSFENDGSYLWYSLQVSPVYNQKGDLDLYIGIQTDITRRKEKDVRLGQTQRLESLGRLAGGVAHDFNNLLSIIDGYSRMAFSAEEEDRKEYLEKIRVSVEKGASITRQLLAFGRGENTHKKVVNLTGLVKDQCALLSPITGETVQISFFPPGKKINAECTPEAIGSILTNLVVNAGDAMPDGGRIDISLDECPPDDLPAEITEKMRGKPYVCMKVEDNGEGISESIRDRIFEPFFTTKQPDRGTGLGLSTVYGLVRDMNGFIDVKSCPGEGTAFSIYLPVSTKEAENNIGALREGKVRADFSGYNAVVAEDETDLLVLMTGLLESWGMTVIRAGNGREALVAQDDFEEDIDLLLTDVVMPELDGIRLAEMFTSLRPETRVLYMSGYPSGGQMSRFDLPEGSCLLQKPVNEKELFEKISLLLAGGQMNDIIGGDDKCLQ